METGHNGSLEAGHDRGEGVGALTGDRLGRASPRWWRMHGVEHGIHHDRRGDDLHDARGEASSRKPSSLTRGRPVRTRTRGAARRWSLLFACRSTALPEASAPPTMDAAPADRPPSGTWKPAGSCFDLTSLSLQLPCPPLSPGESSVGHLGPGEPGPGRRSPRAALGGAIGGIDRLLHVPFSRR